MSDKYFVFPPNYLGAARGHLASCGDIDISHIFGGSLTPIGARNISQIFGENFTSISTMGEARHMTD